MPSAEDEETGQVDLSSNINTTANNNIIQFWNVILLSAKYISTYIHSTQTQLLIITFMYFYFNVPCLYKFSRAIHMYVV